MDGDELDRWLAEAAQASSAAVAAMFPPEVIERGLAELLNEAAGGDGAC